MRLPTIAAIAICTLAGAAAAQTSTVDTGPISPGRMSDIVREIASDAYQGRAPGTPGESRTIAYLTARLKALGLEPAGEHGGWTQDVPLVRFDVEPGASMSLELPGWSQPLRQGQDVMVQTERPRAR